MRVLFANGSPKGEGGDTAHVGKALEKGLIKAGAKVNRYNIGELKIVPCNGCFGLFKCWSNEKIKCRRSNDVIQKEIIPNFMKADLLVFETPIYSAGVTPWMSILLSRFFITSDHHIVMKPNGATGKNQRSGYNGGMTILVGSGGLFEESNFDPMLSHIKDFCRIKERSFAGALLRPHGGLLPQITGKKSILEKISSLRNMVSAYYRKDVTDISGDDPPGSIIDVYKNTIRPFLSIDTLTANMVLEAAEEAGHQLIKTQKIKPVIFDAISAPLVTAENYVKIADNVHRHMFAEAIDRRRS